VRSMQRSTITPLHSVGSVGTGDVELKPSDHIPDPVESAFLRSVDKQGRHFFESIQGFSAIDLSSTSRRTSQLNLLVSAKKNKSDSRVSWLSNKTICLGFNEAKESGAGGGIIQIVDGKKKENQIVFDSRVNTKFGSMSVLCKTGSSDDLPAPPPCIAVAVGSKIERWDVENEKNVTSLKDHKILLGHSLEITALAWQPKEPHMLASVTDRKQQDPPGCSAWFRRFLTCLFPLCAKGRGDHSHSHSYRRWDNAGEVIVWDNACMQVKWKKEMDPPVGNFDAGWNGMCSVGWSPGGHLLAIGCHDYVTILQSSTGKELIKGRAEMKTLQYPKALKWAKLAKGAEYLACGCSQSDSALTLFLWQIETHRQGSQSQSSNKKAQHVSVVKCELAGERPIGTVACLDWAHRKRRGVNAGEDIDELVLITLSHKGVELVAHNSWYVMLWKIDSTSPKTLSCFVSLAIERSESLWLAFREPNLRSADTDTDTDTDTANDSLSLAVSTVDKLYFFNVLR